MLKLLLLSLLLLNYTASSANNAFSAKKL
jgi:hypothetical protein